jgi:TPR repeat protein
MGCILCKVCKANLDALNEKLLKWLEAQTNSVAIMEREADPAAIYQAHELSQTDPAEAFRQYLALAEQGSVWSMAMVGHRFEHGTGTAPDLAEAEKWYFRAYQGGSDYGLIWLGHLYQDSNRYEMAQEVWRSGVARGFVPAMVRLASCYRHLPDWPQRRDEAMALLERGSAAGDLSARMLLAAGMTRGWFGLRHIPDGIRRMFRNLDDITSLVGDEMPPAQDRAAGPGWFGRLAAQLSLLGANRQPASKLTVGRP